MRTEKELEELEDEIKAIKVSFEQSSTTLNTVSAKASFTTVPVTYSFTNSTSWDVLKWLDLMENMVIGGTSFQGPYYAHEMLQVTFRSENGSNVLADLEITDRSDKHNGLIRTLRVEYSGGAKWIIDCTPNTKLYSGKGEVTWYPTILDLTVRTIMPGSLEVIQL